MIDIYFANHAAWYFNNEFLQFCCCGHFALMKCNVFANYRSTARGCIHVQAVSHSRRLDIFLHWSSCFIHNKASNSSQQEVCRSVDILPYYTHLWKYCKIYFLFVGIHFKFCMALSHISQSKFLEKGKLNNKNWES